MHNFVPLKPFSMKYLYILSFVLLCGFSAKAQQIVTHGFMNYILCPDAYSEVDRCNGWRQPTIGTSDYFHACAAGTDVWVPQNIFGYQTNADSAYTGLYTYAPTSVYDYKEYIGTSIDPLIVGHTYTMSITVSLADSSSYATDGLGVYFTTYPYQDLTNYTTILATPQVDYSSYGVLTNKTGWVTLTKTFVADSAYTDLVVGCFKQESALNIDTVGPETSLGGYAYYYIGRIGVPDSTREVVDTTTYVDTTTHVDTTTTVDTTTHHNPVVTDTIRYTFPSGFTPNGDGRNDVFRILTGDPGKIKGYSLSIFNRWGERVFQTYDIYAGWDGVYNGIPQEIGTYFYMAEFTADYKLKMAKGNFTLIR